MNNKILQSIIKITEQRDVETLDHGLITALAENLPLKSITLFKLDNQTTKDSLEQVISLSIQSNEKNEAIYSWNDETSAASDNHYAETCLSDRQSASYPNIHDNQVNHLFPLISDHHIIGVLELVSHQDLMNQKELVNDLIKIYGNCLFFINKSERDKLTGLLNRHSFDTKVRRLIKTQQTKQRLAFENKTANEHRRQSAESFAWLAIFDIDHFKRVNDQYGHVCGDEVLLKLSQKMKDFFRSSDLLFRFGGEEFVVILEPIPYVMAQRTLERFREKIESSVFPLVKTITTSGGYIKITDADYPTAFIERADQALYYAKSHGRNNICNYELLVNRGELPKPKELGAVDLF